jgi:predicted nucleotide-binding protein
MELRPSVFIGSSSEGLHIAEALQQLLDHEAEVTVWSQGIFDLSQSYLESLLKTLETTDFAILAVTADDMVVSRGTEREAPRDNVLFELGLFKGQLGRNRCFFVFDRTKAAREYSSMKADSPPGN